MAVFAETSDSLVQKDPEREEIEGDGSERIAGTWEEDATPNVSMAPTMMERKTSVRQNMPPRHKRQSSSKTQRTLSVKSHTGISPPLTPRASREALQRDESGLAEPTFHNYLRAFYHFHPSSTVSSSTDESSITVPINQGDVILVHSIHPNGWADGTLLVSGARGWLPTNYCEAYDHPAITVLLNALTHLWDLVRSGENENLMVFARQDYVRAMIAGVRFFLERTRCLNRESPLIQAHVGLRRLRKGLLGDLSMLVKTAKKLQEVIQERVLNNLVYELLDDMVLKAFKVVTRAVRLLDIWSQDVVSDEPLDLATERRPLTPPTDTSDATAENAQQNDFYRDQNGHLRDSIATVPQAEPFLPGQATQIDVAQTRTRAYTTSHTIPESSEQGASQPAHAVQRPLSLQGKRTSISHRLSYAGKSGGSKRCNLASEKLSSAHDSFLTHIGAFIGLHLQSRLSSELTSTTQQSVIACRELLSVVDAVWERDGRRSETLEQARDAMYARLSELVQATRDMFAPSSNGDEVIMPEEGKQLVVAATSCVRTAGECVTKTRLVIEMIGDFEFEQTGLGLSDSIFDNTSSSVSVTEYEPQSRSASRAEFDKPLPPPPEPTSKPPPPPLVLAESKPLPEPPLLSPSEPFSPPGITESPVAKSLRSSGSSVPPLSRLSVPPRPLSQQIQSTPTTAVSTDSSQSDAPLRRFMGKGSRAERADSVNNSVAESSSTYPNSVRDEEASYQSDPSTRATTPDRSPVTKNEDTAMMSSFGSVSELHSLTSDSQSLLEEQVLEKTYAHELVYNKEGQIVGGSLPALVEKLTTHDSTPDAMFVTTFYLTFRLFTTPCDFAQSLVDRFEYIGDNQEVGVPVRLRVYNIFKGWLESHWQSDADTPALALIVHFAAGRLMQAIPAAGKRLAELAAKVTEMRAGALVPRLVSSLGKTSTSVTVFSAADSQIPSSIITKSQLNALRGFRTGGPQCSILDFDPLELARQFTIIESRIFCSIGPEELLASEWTKKTDSKAMNVRAMSTLSTDLANLVADTILQFEEPKKRAIIIKQWVKIAYRCLELNNYDSLMAIICSLNSSMVLRLKRTWELVSQKTHTRLEELKQITDVGRNYAVLRQRLQNHVAPCIPFVGIYLTDLTFVDVGNQTTRQLPGDGTGAGASVINFDKHMKTAKIIGQLQRFQVPYRLAAIPEMQDWMEAQIQRVRSSDQANVQSYYRRSLMLEPREVQQITGAHHTRNSPSESVPGGKSATPSLKEGKDKFDFWEKLPFAASHSSKEKLQQ